MAELKKTTRGEGPSGIFAPIGGHNNDNKVLALIGDDFSPHDLNVAMGRPGQLTVATTQFIPAEIPEPVKAPPGPKAVTETPKPKRSFESSEPK